MLSKSTVNKVILTILEVIRRKIKVELGDKQFSIQVDSTQDVGSTGQAAVCIRYVFNSEVKEHLFAILEVKNSSGKGKKYELLKQCLMTIRLILKTLLVSLLTVLRIYEEISMAFMHT
eukprot:XP_016659030.1 PREDICTED: uncharacterized protein LOC107883467 [Acyrthosiphon pisum]